VFDLASFSKYKKQQVYFVFIELAEIRFKVRMITWLNQSM